MSEDDTLQRHIADIGKRYLKRTRTEVELLRAMLQAAKDGSGAALVQLGQMAHRIHGSGAMFGFDAISERAYEIERLARERSDGSVYERIESALEALEAEVRSQTELRGLE
jgi:HPt (histidine-containing phosphotransfer) domain-containing protein